MHCAWSRKEDEYTATSVSRSRRAHGAGLRGLRSGACPVLLTRLRLQRVALDRLVDAGPALAAPQVLHRFGRAMHGRGPAGELLLPEQCQEQDHDEQAADVQLRDLRRDGVTTASASDSSRFVGPTALETSYLLNDFNNLVTRAMVSGTHRESASPINSQ